MLDRHVAGGTASPACFLLRQLIRRKTARPALQPERHDPAHRSLPFGTKLRVTHGGRSVVVTSTIVARSSAAGCSNLSTGAARAIGLTGAALGRVTAEVVS